MKKYIIFIVIFIAGLIMGYLFFGGASNAAEANHDHANEEANQMWTCSMHPQIMQPDPGACPICGMDLIPADASADGLSANQFKMTSNAMALANIQTALVGEVSADGVLRLSGKIKESEKANATQTVHFGGRIEKLYVNYTGEKVNRGQLLALIYSPELLSAQQELLTAAKLRETQPDLYNAVKNKLKFWKLSDKQIESIVTSGKIKENIPVYANASGVVTEKLVEEGDYVKQGQPLYKVSDLGTVWAEFDAYENQIASLKHGQPIIIKTKAYPNEEFEAKVSFIDPVLNNTTRTVIVRADIRNNHGRFKPGMFIEGVFEGVDKKAENFITVPKSAVLWTGKRSLVYVKTDESQPIFEMREVTIGSTTGDGYVITKGLEFGEEVVINGTFTVDAAAQLQGKKSMMNNDDGMSMEMTLSADFQKDFFPVIKSYMGLKDVLVASDAVEAKNEAKEGLTALSEVKTTTLGKMEQQHLEIIQKMLETISDSDDLENQRSHFKILSENMISMVSNFNELNDTLYVQYCPMANSNKGAYWLSLEDEVLNPYYGDAMLSCGEVTKTIQ